VKAKDIMTTAVISVRPETDVREIARLLLDCRISAVPVVADGGKLIGIVSEGDLMRRPETGSERIPSWWLDMFASPEDSAWEYVKTHGRRARDVMSDKVMTVDEEASLDKIAAVLEHNRIKRVPVAREGRIVGIVSRANLLQGLATARIDQSAPSDEAIRTTILTRIRDEAGIRNSLLNVTVAGGTVHLWGGVRSEAERQAAHVVADNVSGVEAIEDHLTVMPTPEAAWSD
jgi:CBS-domain-containing membrane protein